MKVFKMTQNETQQHFLKISFIIVQSIFSSAMFYKGLKRLLVGDKRGTPKNFKIKSHYVEYLT